MKALIALFWSLVIIGISAALFVPGSHDPALIWFMLFLIWPGIWFGCAMWTSNANMGTYDAVKMQNLYNLDAIRRNSDQQARNNQPWQNKK